MRRPTDRTEAWFGLALIVVLLACAPALSWYAGHTAYVAGTRAERVQRLDRHPVRARVLTSASYQSPDADQGPMALFAPVEWKATDGSRRTSLARVPPGTRTGSVRTVWTDDSGRLVGEPQRHDKTVAMAALAATLGPTVLIGTGFGLRALLRRSLERRRLEQWQQEWEQIGPTWSRLR